MPMTDADPRRRSRAARGGAIGRFLRAHRRHASRQRACRDLLRLDDRLLRDIGMTREMVHREMLEPFRWPR